MGLDTSHDCWNGAYSAFTRWRNTLAEAAGYTFFVAQGDYLPSVSEIRWEEITDANYAGQWDRMPEDPLIVLLAHSDCDGEIQPGHAGPLADRLEQLLPKLPPEEEATGHLSRRGYRGTTERFITGLRTAAAANEPVVFC